MVNGQCISEQHLRFRSSGRVFSIRLSSGKIRSPLEKTHGTWVTWRFFIAKMVWFGGVFGGIQTIQCRFHCWFCKGDGFFTICPCFHHPNKSLITILSWQSWGICCNDTWRVITPKKTNAIGHYFKAGHIFCIFIFWSLLRCITSLVGNMVITWSSFHRICSIRFHTYTYMSWSKHGVCVCIVVIQSHNRKAGKLCKSSYQLNQFHKLLQMDWWMSPFMVDSSISEDNVLTMAHI